MTNGFTYYWCDDCGWDSVRMSDDIKGPCPMCAGDNGSDGNMKQKECPKDQGSVEGLDDRKKIVE